MVSQWKHELLNNATGIFEGKESKAARKSQEKIDTLYYEIGKLTVKSDFYRADSIVEPGSAPGTLGGDCKPSTLGHGRANQAGATGSIPTC